MTNLESKAEIFRARHEAFILGCDSIEELKLWDKETHGEMDAFYSNDLATVIIKLIGVDGVIDKKEVEYFNKTFGFDYTKEEMIAVYNSCVDDISRFVDESFENGVTLMRKINVKLADAYKALLQLVSEIIIESDGIVAEKELEEVRRFKALCEG